MKDENGPNHEAENLNPPIITQGSKPVLPEKEYTEYFMQDEEKAKSFRLVLDMLIRRSVASDCRGETEQLHDTNTKDKGSINWAKFCCWIFILALLAGAVAVGVLIGSKLVRSLLIRSY